LKSKKEIKDNKHQNQFAVCFNNFLLHLSSYFGIIFLSFFLVDQENYHASFEKRGRWVYSTELLEKEEMLE